MKYFYFKFDVEDFLSWIWCWGFMFQRFLHDVRLKAFSLVLVEFPGLFWKVYFGLTDHFFNFFVSNLRIPVTPLYLQKINWIGSRTVLIIYVMNTLTKAFLEFFAIGEKGRSIEQARPRETMSPPRPSFHIWKHILKAEEKCNSQGNWQFC